MEGEWWQVVIGAVVAILAIRITINVPEWLKYRDERAEKNLRSLCPHTELEIEVDKTRCKSKVIWKSKVISPPGTRDWSCQSCGFCCPGGEEQAAEFGQYWAQNPKRWISRMKKYNRYYRKHVRS